MVRPLPIALVTTADLEEIPLEGPLGEIIALLVEQRVFIETLGNRFELVLYCADGKLILDATAKGIRRKKAA